MYKTKGQIINFAFTGKTDGDAHFTHENIPEILTSTLVTTDGTTKTSPTYVTTTSSPAVYTSAAQVGDAQTTESSTTTTFVYKSSATPASQTSSVLTTTLRFSTTTTPSLQADPSVTGATIANSITTGRSAGALCCQLNNVKNY